MFLCSQAGITVLLREADAEHIAMDVAIADKADDSWLTLLIHL